MTIIFRNYCHYPKNYAKIYITNEKPIKDPSLLLIIHSTDVDIKTEILTKIVLTKFPKKFDANNDA